MNPRIPLLVGLKFKLRYAGTDETVKGIIGTKVTDAIVADSGAM